MNPEEQRPQLRAQILSREAGSSCISWMARKDRMDSKMVLAKHCGSNHELFDGNGGRACIKKGVP
jgi:hypothetical protein